MPNATLDIHWPAQWRDPGARELRTEKGLGARGAQRWHALRRRCLVTGHGIETGRRERACQGHSAGRHHPGTHGSAGALVLTRTTAARRFVRMLLHRHRHRLRRDVVGLHRACRHIAVHHPHRRATHRRAKHRRYRQHQTSQQSQHMKPAERRSAVKNFRHFRKIRSMPGTNQLWSKRLGSSRTMATTGAIFQCPTLSRRYQTSHRARGTGLSLALANGRTHLLHFACQGTKKGPVPVPLPGAGAYGRIRLRKTLW